ncbi:60S ribosomal protein L12 [Iris pallida]|uniref:60S ribosomal protein L12 n=1 Tax=Iris pallida TaxID=29817 RepID=A0AAX6F265_IRIPA|nr:60S ribosomal protein L12 [Iris pallida]
MPPKFDPSRPSRRRVHPRHRRRGRRRLLPRPEDRPPRPLPKEDRGGHRQGDRQGLEGPPRHRQAHRPEPPGQGLRRPLRLRARHQGPQGT